MPKTDGLSELSLGFHIQEVLAERRRFENAAQAVTRMIHGSGLDKVTRGGRTVYDYRFFREGKKHPIGWFKEINEFVNFVEEAARHASSAEQAFVLIGEPGNGKTFFVDYVCDKYRQFLTLPGNQRYTFEFFNLDQVGQYGNIHVIQSQTFEDPIILAMNLFASTQQGKAYLAEAGFSDQRIDQLYADYRPLGACTEYILNDIRRHCDGDLQKMLEFVRVAPVLIATSLGTVTGKYSARDKITSSSVDLLGEEDLSRILNLADTSNPYKYNVRRGALARVAGGGIHFSDEICRNKSDLVQVYLQVVQNRNIELDGYRWPIDTLVVCTSNGDAYNDFVAEKKEAPVKDRFKLCYVSHNTDYLLQQELTRYAIGSEKKTTVIGKGLHEDPNLGYAISVLAVLTRLPHTDKLTPLETMKLEAGEVAGEKSVETLIEIKNLLNKNQDVTRRWGQRGIGHRGLGRIIQRMLAMSETHEGECLFARDIFQAFEEEVADYVADGVDRDKFLKDLVLAKKLYRQRIETSIFNAYMEDADAVKRDVMGYINMIVALGSGQLGPDKTWPYRDPRTGKLTAIKVDETYLNNVETRLGLNSRERIEDFRDKMRMLHGQKLLTNPNYDFMDNEALVKAVTEVKLKSDVNGVSSLAGALANRTNDENVQLNSRMIKTMVGTLGYCAKTCAVKTIEYFCTPEDQS